MLTFILHSLGRILLQISVEGKTWCCLINLKTPLNHAENLTTGICAVVEGQPLRQDFDLAPVVGGHSQIHLVEGPRGTLVRTVAPASPQTRAQMRSSGTTRAQGQSEKPEEDGAEVQIFKAVGAVVMARAAWAPVRSEGSRMALRTPPARWQPRHAARCQPCVTSPASRWGGGPGAAPTQRASHCGVWNPRACKVAAASTAAWMLLGRWVALPASSWHGRLSGHRISETYSDMFYIFLQKSMEHVRICFRDSIMISIAWNHTHTHTSEKHKNMTLII